MWIRGYLGWDNPGPLPGCIYRHGAKNFLLISQEDTKQPNKEIECRVWSINAASGIKLNWNIHHSLYLYNNNNNTEMDVHSGWYSPGQRALNKYHILFTNSSYWQKHYCFFGIYVYLSSEMQVPKSLFIFQQVYQNTSSWFTQSHNWIMSILRIVILRD